MVKAVRENGIVLQTGTQQRSSQRFRLACELVRNGRLGKLKQARVWLPAGLRGGPFKPPPVPAGLDWDFWQGQAPAADYVTERCHRTFRFWYEYSGGTMTDWGAHHNDIAYWAIGLLAPRDVTAKHFSEPVPGGYNAYADYEVNYTYANGIGLQINTTKDDSIFGERLNPQGQRNGIRFEGTDGWIWVNRDEINASEPELLRTPLPATRCGSTRARTTWATSSTACARASCPSATSRPAIAPPRCAISGPSRCAPDRASPGIPRRRSSWATTRRKRTAMSSARCASPTTTPSSKDRRGQGRRPSLVSTTSWACSNRAP